MNADKHRTFQSFEFENNGRRRLAKISEYCQGALGNKQFALQKTLQLALTTTSPARLFR